MVENLKNEFDNVQPQLTDHEGHSIPEVVPSEEVAMQYVIDHYYKECCVHIYNELFT